MTATGKNARYRLPSTDSSLLFPEGDQDEYDHFQVAFVRTSSLLLMLAPLLVGALLFWQGKPNRLAATLPFAAIGLLVLAIMYSGRSRLASQILVYGVWAGAVNAMLWAGGIFSPALLSLPVVILLSGWLAGLRATIVLTVVSPLVMIVMALASEYGLPVPVAAVTGAIHASVVAGFTLAAAGLLGYYAARSLQARLDRLRQSERSLEEKVAQLSQRDTELVALRHRFEVLFRAGPTPSTIISLGSAILVDCNAAFCELIGRSREEIIGRDAISLGIWRDPAQRTKAFGQVLHDQGTVRDFEAALVRSDGTERICLLALQRVDIGGETQVLTQITDITNLRRAETAQRESEAMFSAGFHSSPDAMLFTRTRDHVIAEVNPGFERLTGFSRADVVGRTGFDLGLWRDRDVRDRLIGEVLTGRTVTGAPFSARMKDGSILDCRYTGTLVHLRGEPHVLSIVRDVTAEAVANAALAESEQHLAEANRQLRLQVSLHEFTEHVARVGHWFTNQRNDQVEYSPALFELLGLPPRKTMTIEVARQLIHIDEKDKLQAARERRDAQPATYRAVRADGQAKWLRISITPRPDAPAEMDEYFGVAQDVTVEHEAKLALERLNLELEQRVAARTSALQVANEELDAFSYSVAHDLRSPLRAINGFAAILAEDAGNHLAAGATESIEKIRRAANRMDTLIADLLRLAQLSRAPLNRSRINLSQMAREIAAELDAVQPGRVVIWRIQEGLVADADEGLLRSLLQNLLGNAWKYTRDQPHTVIVFGASISPTGPVEFVVRDNGAGFPMANASRLFAPFQRLHGSEFEGTGIGLATAQRIVRRHGGQIRAEAEKGLGASFFFTLPAVDAA